MSSKDVGKGSRDGRREIFVVTPPPEAKNCLFAGAASQGNQFMEGGKESGNQVEFIDMRQARDHAKVRRLEFARLPEEDRKRECVAR